MPELIVTKDIDAPGLDTLDGYREHDGYQALEKALKEYQPDDLVELMKKSGLRGRGGAGFPTGLKWSFLAKNDKPRYLCCNADESEPGTFKDRMLMEKNPHQLVEGVIITSYACRVTTAFIYVRGELALAGRQIARAIDEAYAAGYIGKNILGSDYSLERDYASRRGRVYLRRGERVDGVAGGSARLSTFETAIPGGSRPLRRANGHQQLRDAFNYPRHYQEWGRLVRHLWH